VQWEEEVDVYRSHLEESALDLTKREELRQTEIELVRQRERVAATLDHDGAPRHVYPAHPHLSDDIDQRDVDLLTPAWHRLDLTPKGRGEWCAGLDYRGIARW
jgi:predicted dithiol-disulfide oxidoreductase (DUF899 family)